MIEVRMKELKGRKSELGKEQRRREGKLIMKRK